MNRLFSSLYRAPSQILAVAAAITLLPLAAFAQLNPFSTGGAEAPLVNSSPSGGLNAGTYMQRAQGAATVANASANPFAGTVPAAPAAPAGGFAPVGMAAPPAPFGAAPSQFAAPGAAFNPGAIALPSLPTVKVLAGQQVLSHVSYELLSDAEIKSVVGAIADLKNNYYDDGTHGDVKANDQILSNVTRTMDYMAPSEFRIMNQVIAALTAGENRDPADFFQIPVSTSDPLSQLPKQMDLEVKRDERLEEWNSQRLDKFRKKTGDPQSTFWPLFVPPPPPAPSMELPVGFDPTGKTIGAGVAQAGGGAAFAPAAGGPAVGAPVSADGMPPSEASAAMANEAGLPARQSSYMAGPVGKQSHIQKPDFASFMGMIQITKSKK